jgi:PAS domain S-box-containing protein
MGMTELPHTVSAASPEVFNEAQFQRLKQDDFLRPTMAIALAGAVLVFVLWLWDWSVDAAHAPDTVWLRLLMSASFLSYPLAILAGVRRSLPLVFYGMALWLQMVFLWILARLDGGAVHGMAGFMFWFIVPPLMTFVLPLRGNILGNLAVVACPSMLAVAVGLLPQMDLFKLNALLVPAGVITIAGHLMIDRLLRRIYEYRWQFQWRSVAIDALAEGVVVVQHGLICYANQAAAAMVGRTPAQIVGAARRDFIDLDDKSDFSQPLLVQAPHGQAAWVRLGRSAIDWQGQPATLVSVTDVSAQVLADESLRKSEERYREVVDNAAEGIIVMQDNRLVFANAAVETITGDRHENFIGKDFISFIHPDDRETVIDRITRRMRGEVMDPRFEFRIVKITGQAIWVQIIGVRIQWDGVASTLYFLSDIDKRKRAEEALRHSEERHRLLVNHASEGILISQAGILRFVNPRIAALAGRDAADLLGQPLLRFIHTEDHAVLIERFRKRQRGEAVSLHELFRLVRPDGSIVWIETSGVEVPWEGAPAVLSFLIDVTERRHLEENLRRTLSEREAILQSTLVGITFAVNRRHQWVNRRFADMLGYEPQELVGQLSLLHYPDEASWQRFGDEAYPLLARGLPYHVEMPARRKDGCIIWVEIFGTAIDPADLGKGTIWTYLDITTRKQAEEDVRVALEKQTELNQLKSRFVSMTSHEFRTPLAAILSSTELLKYYEQRLAPQEKAELVDGIGQSVQRMTTMLDDILLIGRAEADRLDFAPAPLPLRAFCQSVVEELARSRRGGGQPDQRIEFSMGTLDAEPVLDEALARRILGNLLSNALKYSPEDKPVRLTVHAHAAGVRFTVADQGIGIPDADLPHLFETFHRASNVGNISGTGLGLAIVKKAVDLHGGSIAVHSELGRGTTFTVTL